MPAFPSLLANPRLPNTNGWQGLHNAAVNHPHPGFEASMVAMLQGWAAYARVHWDTYHSTVGDDGVLGPEWQAIGEALRGLLNGHLERLDGGTLDRFINNTMHSNGVEVDQ